MQRLAADFDTLAVHYPAEKIYVHFDKPGYITGDTLWFKVYLFTAANLHASPLSGMMYVEMADEENKVVKRMVLPVVGGLNWGDIPLDTAFKQGTYTFRAYTRWVLNFNRHYIFTRRIKITGHLQDPWIARMSLDHKTGQTTVNLRLTHIGHRPVAWHAVRLSLVKDNRLLHTNTQTTDQNGTLKFHFTQPVGKAGRISLWVGEKNGQPKINIPLLLHQPQDIDLQLMPEGGNIIPGWPELILHIFR